MTPDELRSIGEKLYGPCWQTPLARALPVSTRTVRYWLTGKRAIRPVIAERIRQLAAEKVAGRGRRSKAEHEYGAIQGSSVRPFLKTACDKLAKQMGEKIKADYREILQQHAAKTVLRETEQLVAPDLCQRCGRGKNSRFHLRECGWHV